MAGIGNLSVIGHRPRKLPALRGVSPLIPRREHACSSWAQDPVLQSIGSLSVPSCQGRDNASYVGILGGGSAQDTGDSL